MSGILLMPSHPMGDTSSHAMGVTSSFFDDVDKVAHAIASGQAAVSGSTSAFSLSLPDWQLEWQTAAAIGRLMATAPPYLQLYWQRYLARQQASDIQSLYDGFRDLMPHAQEFNGPTFTALQATAQGVVSYARDIVPKDYGRMRDILAAAETTPPSAKDQIEFMSVVQECRAAVDRLSAPAQALANQIQGYAQSLKNFTNTFAQIPHKPAQLVADSGQVPVCVDGNNNVVGSSPAPADNSLWSLLWDPARGAYRIIMASRPGMCIGPNVPQNMRRMIGIFPFVLSFACHLEPIDLGDPYQLWGFDPRAARTEFTYFQVQGMCMDISGNSGWGPGTQVLGFRKNGGSNQHWTFMPKLLQFWDEAFYNAVGPFARNTQILTVMEYILGTWKAVSDDLNAVQSTVKTQFDLNKPFISGLNVDATIGVWTHTGTEARNFIQNATAAHQKIA